MNATYAPEITLSMNDYFRDRQPRPGRYGGGQIVTAPAELNGNGGEIGEADHHGNRILGCKYFKNCDDCTFRDCRWQPDGKY